MKSSPRNKSKSYGDTPEIAPRAGKGSPRVKNGPAPARLWPALVALNGFGLAVNHASALELGELNVHSTLGQPLRASIAYALGQHELLESHCIFLRPPASATGLPVVRNATASASNGLIRLTGTVPVREPLLSMRLTIDCQGTANLSRDYTLFIDPSQASPAPVSAHVRAPVAAPGPARSAAGSTETAAQTVQRPAARAVAADAPPIGNRSTYRVQPGDTLSGIAARIDDRAVGLWDAVEVIFAANPDAFIDNNRDRLKAGSLLILPDMGTVAAAPAGRPAEARSVAPVREAAPETATLPETAAPERPQVVREPVSVTAAVTEPPAGDASGASESPFVSAPGSDVASGVAASDDGFTPPREVIPNTPAEATTGRQLTPRVSVARSDTGDGLSSLAWLGGSGIAIILALLLFGRRLKDRFGSPADMLSAGIIRGRRRGDLVEQTEPATTLADDDPTDTYESPLRAQPVTGDADLGTGSGFDDDGEIDLAQDFGFSTSRDLYGNADVELPEEALREAAHAPTDVIPAKRFEGRRLTDTVIVEKEIPPSHDTGEYDLSMILDATRQPMGESEDTTKDLRAVQVDTRDHEALESGQSLTLSREVDYKVLEQDYEDELTATQALNAKLAKEAALAVRAAGFGERESADNAEAPTVEYVAIDAALTSELPHDDDNDDKTVEMPLDQEPVSELPDTLGDSGVNAEVTTELPAADNDETIDIEIESATIDTKKLRAS